MKENVGKIPMDELCVAAKLDGMRAEIPGFLDLSFPTISAYKSNAAMAHYSATEAHFSKIEAEGFYLVDSGGQYEGGTTDVTRTIALGAVTDEMKLHFTKVACAMLRLADTKFCRVALVETLTLLRGNRSGNTSWTTNTEQGMVSVIFSMFTRDRIV